MKLWVLVLVLIVPYAAANDLKVGFYKSTCPNAESIVRQVVQKRFGNDRSITAALLRMHFHDCFVTGCDASILIDSTKQKQSEKDAGPNLTVRGYDLIDQIKTALEAQCPATVSCADTIALATRDAIALAGGPTYAVPTGRRDGLVSNMDEVDLPGPSFSASEALKAFNAKGLTLTDMVTLLGAHTVGVAHCSFFQDRLQNFQGSGSPDPSMDPSLATRLSKICSNPNMDPTVFLDQNTSFVFDNEFYKQLLLKRGILQIDQELAMDRSSASIVSSFGRNGVGFKQSFRNAMVKMGSIGVLAENSGEIRTNCRVVNAIKKPIVTNPPPKQQKENVPKKSSKKPKAKKPKVPHKKNPGKF